MVLALATYREIGEHMTNEMTVLTPSTTGAKVVVSPRQKVLKRGIRGLFCLLSVLPNRGGSRKEITASLSKGCPPKCMIADGLNNGLKMLGHHQLRLTAQWLFKVSPRSISWTTHVAAKLCNAHDLNVVSPHSDGFTFSLVRDESRTAGCRRLIHYVTFTVVACGDSFGIRSRKYPDRTKHTSLPAHVKLFRSTLSVDFSTCLQPTEVQVSAMCLRRTDIPVSSERNELLRPYHIHRLRSSQTLWFGCRRHTHFHSLPSQSPIQRFAEIYPCLQEEMSQEV